MKIGKLIVIVAVLVLDVVVVVRFFSSHTDKTAQAQALDFSLPDVSGKQQGSTQWQGKVRVINFWATWCAPCRKEIPEFIALQNQYGANGLQVIGIAIDKPEAVKQYMESMKMNYPVLIAEHEGIELAQNLGNQMDAVPYTVIIDRKNQIIHTQAGEFSKEHLLGLVQPLMK